MQPRPATRCCRLRRWRSGRVPRQRRVPLGLRRLGPEPLEDRRLLDGGGYTELLPDDEPSGPAVEAGAAQPPGIDWVLGPNGDADPSGQAIDSMEAESEAGGPFGIGDTVKVSGTGTQGLNVRVGPGLDQPEITDPEYPGFAPEGTIGIVLAGPVSASGYDWYQVDYGPGLYSGWSVADYLQEVPTDVLGIDVSHWQGAIQWPQVAGAGYAFAFCKATEATSYTDVRFVTNIQGGHNNGMLMGAYHFGRPEDQTDTAAEEAQHLVDVAGPYFHAGYLRPVLDLETGYTLGKAALSAWVHEFMSTVIAETGVEPIIYCNSNYAINYLDASIAEYDLWIANWYVPSPNTGIWDDWEFWQYSSTGSVPGISGNVDMDQFNGNRSALDGFAITELSISNVALSEGNSGTKSFDFTVSLSSASSRDVTIAYQTANGTAVAGSDYSARSGTLTFLAGQTSKTISVPVSGDPTFESDEVFYVNLSNPHGAIVADSQGRGTIQNDDLPPAQITGRYVFYDNSIWDDPLQGRDDDDAIADGKTALLPGETPSAANLTSYACGINGIMVDIAGLHGTLAADDFAFRAGSGGDPAGWDPVSTAPTIEVRPGEGAGGSTRVVLHFEDRAIENEWLQVTVLAGADTGLSEPDVFYFGNLPGDASGDGTVMDADAAILAAHWGATGVAVQQGDFNGDGVVDSADASILGAHWGMQIEPPEPAELLASPPQLGGAPDRTAVIGPRPASAVPAARRRLNDPREAARQTAREAAREAVFAEESGYSPSREQRLAAAWSYEMARQHVRQRLTTLADRRLLAEVLGEVDAFLARGGGPAGQQRLRTGVEEGHSPPQERLVLQDVPRRCCRGW